MGTQAKKEWIDFIDYEEQQKIKFMILDLMEHLDLEDGEL